MPTSAVVERWKDTYNKLDFHHLHLLGDLYAGEVVFEDPIHRIEGFAALEKYFAGMYENVESCRFEWVAEVIGDGEAMVSWIMVLRHKKFRAGETVRVPGSSHIRYTDKVTYHRDYFDVGALIYERVPVLGGIIRWIKGRL